MNSKTEIGAGVVVAFVALILCGIMFSGNAFFAIVIFLAGGGLAVYLINIGVQDKGVEEDAKNQIIGKLTLALPSEQTTDTTRADEGNTPAAQQPGITALGRRTDGARNSSVSDTDRQSGMYILGVQGTGKSSFMEQVIFQDIAKGYAVIVLDPHSDLLDHIIAQLPQERLAKTYLLDIEDTTHPFGLNLFSIAPDANTTQQQQALDRVLHVFEKCFPDTSRMLLEKYLGNIAPVFFANAQAGYGMTDIPTFLRDDSFRAKLTKNSRLFIRQFWQDEYNQLSPSKRQGETASLATRLNRFVRSPITGNIIGQATTTIDFRKAIEQKEILLIRLPVKTLREDAQLIGTMLVAQIYAAIFSFADTSQENRPGFSLFVDEFQHFATQDFADMFTEGRKFGSRVCVAHQFREQLPDYLAKASMTARTIVTFQTTHEDATKMAHLYMNLPKQRKTDRDTIDPDPIKYLLKYGSDNQNIKYFIDKYLRPYKEAAEKSVMLEPSGTVAERTVKRNQEVAERDRKQQILDNFNRLLYEAQVQGNAAIQLPQDILNFCYETFDLSVIGIRNRENCIKYIEWVSSPADPAYDRNIFGNPQTFANQEALSATRERIFTAYKQKNSNYLAEYYILTLDSFLTCIAEIRWFISELVQNPIGDIKPVTSSEIAASLVNLPRREAYAKIGTTSQHIRTFDTPAGVSQDTFRTRKQTIQQQTRAKYCRPVSQVEAAISKRLGLEEEKPETGTEPLKTAKAEPEQQPDRPLYEEE